MDQKFKAALALLGTILLWSFMVVIARVTVASVPPMTLLFLRLSIATLIFLPFFISGRSWKESGFSKLILVSLFSSANLTFFIWGIQYTSASVSQLIYGTMPILVVIINTIFFKAHYQWQKIFGVLVGFSGIIFIIYLSALERGTTITGSLIGNLVIFAGQLAWVWYLLLSKKLSRTFSPIEISSVSIITSFIISIPLFLGEIIWLKQSIYVPMNGILAAGYMGLFGTFFTYILYQYAIKHASTLTVSLASYIQPITTTVLELIFLNEKLTFNFLIGGMLVFSGVFLTTTLELYNKRKRKN